MRHYIVAGLMAMALMATVPAMADSHCTCTQECQEKCSKGDAAKCDCKSCDCKEGNCKHHKCGK